MQMGSILGWTKTSPCGGNQWGYATALSNVSIAVSGSQSSQSGWIAGASNVVVQFKNSGSGTLRGDVFSSNDGVTWDDVAWATKNIAANKTSSLDVTPGPGWIYITLTETGASAVSSGWAIIQAQWT